MIEPPKSVLPGAAGPGGFTKEGVDRARELGIDLGMLEENLALTPVERMRQHNECVRQLLATQERLGVRDHETS